MNWLELIFGSGECLTALGTLAIIGIVSAALAAATAATEGGMAAVSAKEARRKEEKNRAEIEEEKRKRENLFDARYHQDMTDRTEVQGMLREMRERQDAQRNQNEARAAVLGETAEQQIAEQEGLNKAYADSIAGMTSNASLLKDSYLDKYENSMDKYYADVRAHNSRMAEIEMNRSNQLAQGAANAANAATNVAVMAAGMADGGPGKTPLKGTAPKATSTMEGLSKPAQYNKAQQLASSPLEKGIMGDMAAAAKQVEVNTPPVTLPNTAVQKPVNPWEVPNYNFWYHK